MAVFIPEDVYDLTLRTRRGSEGEVKWSLGCRKKVENSTVTLFFIQFRCVWFIFG